jgi:hypothetical protein
MLRLPLAATAIVVAAIVIFWLASVVGASHKLQGLEPIAASRGNYAIELAFAPERFHQTWLQEQGRLVEVRDKTVFMMDVTPTALHDIASKYWVTSIARWSGR